MSDNGYIPPDAVVRGGCIGCLIETAILAVVLLVAVLVRP